MVNFKAKENKTVYKKLLSDNNVIKGLIHIECINNAWSTETIWIIYINKNFFFKYWIWKSDNGQSYITLA